MISWTLHRSTVRACATLLLISSGVGASAGRRDDLVLVASRNAPISEISERDVRRLFMGVAPESAPAGTRAVFNDADGDASATFLRAYLFMTASHYERLLAGRRYRDGLPPLARADSDAAVARKLQGDPRLVSFVSRDRLPGLGGVKVIAVK